MPYLVFKRSDVPSSVLQALDLVPNTSLRNFPYEPVGQTKYIRQIDNDAVVILDNGGVKTTAADARGLTAWFLTNVNDGTGAVATGTITTVAEGSLVDGETFTLDDGVQSVTFEFDLAGGDGVTGGNVAVVLPGGGSADDVRDAIISAITGSVLDITAASGGAGQVDLTNNTVGTIGNTTSSETVANGTFAVTDMAGGVDADALTAAEAATNADDVLGLLNYDASGAAGALTLAAINGALTTGEITALQLPDLLAILAGAEYLVPAGTQVEAASAFGVSPAISFDASETSRHVYLTGALRMSFAEGKLSKLVSSDFTYGGVAGQALVVYNDDGSLFTV